MGVVMRFGRILILLCFCWTTALYAAVPQIVQPWYQQLLMTITTPNWAYILLLVSLYGILFEIMSPGLIFPAVIGVVSLVASIYALHSLPVNLLALGLLVTGVLVMILQALVRRFFGAVGLAGVLIFILGSLRLFPPLMLDWSVLITGTVMTAVFFLFIVRLAVRSQYKKVITGGEDLIGATAKVVEVNSKGLLVRLRGELWQAQADGLVRVGDEVKVISRDGLVLRVRRVCSPD